MEAVGHSWTSRILSEHPPVTK